MSLNWLGSYQVRFSAQIYYVVGLIANIFYVWSNIFNILLKMFKWFIALNLVVNIPCSSGNISRAYNVSKSFSDNWSVKAKVKYSVLEAQYAQYTVYCTYSKGHFKLSLMVKCKVVLIPLNNLFFFFFLIFFS